MEPGVGNVSGVLQSLRDSEDSDEQEAAKQTSWGSMLSIDYYQSYFDVTTHQVIERILAGMIPIRLNLVDCLQSNPDLYGPFWLAMTLILCTAISGNITNLLDNQTDWEFHFHEVTLIGCCVYTYTWLVPCVLWALLWWQGNRLRYTLLQLLAIYGYSIGIFIPLMGLWLLRNGVLRWVLWALSTVSSGSVLLKALWKPMSQENPKLKFFVLTLVFVLHAGLSVGFKLYYFNSALAPSSDLVSSVNVTHTLH